MQKLYKYFLIFSSILLAILLPISLPNGDSCDAPSPANAAISSTSSIFKEVTNDGIASYLEITIPGIPSNISGVKITQTIGSVSYSPTTDELGNTCYYINASGVSNKTLAYKFTRAATYTVQYTLVSGDIISETCAFTPEINKTVLNNLFTTPDGGETKNNLSSSNSASFALFPGSIEIPFNDELYTLSASTKGIAQSSLLSNIPDNSFGEITYTLTSNTGHTKLYQKLIVITADFDIEFSDLDNIALNKSDHAFLGESAETIGYTFNQAIKFNVTVDPSAIDLTGNALSAAEKLTLLNTLDFKINETKRNETNTGNGANEIINLKSPTETPEISHTLEIRDHSIFEIQSFVKNATSSDGGEYINSIPKIKIITKVPFSDAGDYAFSAILGQVDNTKTNNYINGVLNGYVPLGTTIYYPTTAVRLFYNGYTNKNDKLHFEASSSGVINKGGSRDFTQNGSTITVYNETIAFEEFYTFSFTIKTYSGTGFIDLLRNRMMYNGNSYITDDFSDVENTLSTPINSFRYTLPANYETDCIPLHMRVTYNNTSFDKVYNFKSGDVIEFSEFGDYVVEFYNLPSYEFLTANLSTLSNTLYYYKLSFNIAGPSILATTTDSNGKTITVSDYLYTQNKVNVSVDLQPGQQFIAYLNGNEYARRTESLNFDLTSIGTWKISIVDTYGNELKNLTFAIADTIYQGFSINTHDEYESFTVYKQISKMPAIYEQMEAAQAYHLTQAGTYKIDLGAKEELLFTVNSAAQSSYTVNSNSIVVEIAKSHFSLLFAEGQSGARISSSVSIIGVSGVQLQSLEVYRDDKLVKTFTAEQLINIETIMENERSFSDNGTYTFRLTDKFGNTYEAQIEKYYKVNVALIILIILGVAGLVVMLVVIIKSRHKVNIK